MSFKYLEISSFSTVPAMPTTESSIGFGRIRVERAARAVSAGCSSHVAKVNVEALSLHTKPVLEH